MNHIEKHLKLNAKAQNGECCFSICLVIGSIMTKNLNRLPYAVRLT